MRTSSLCTVPAYEQSSNQLQHTTRQSAANTTNNLPVVTLEMKMPGTGRIWRWLYGSGYCHRTRSDCRTDQSYHPGPVVSVSEPLPCARGLLPPGSLSRTDLDLDQKQSVVLFKIALQYPYHCSGYIDTFP